MVSELLKYITIRVISESSECRWRHQRHGKTQKTQKGKGKARKRAGKASHYVHWEIFWKTSTQGSTALSNWSPLWENFWRTFSAKCAPEMTCQLPWSLHIYLRPPFASHWKNSLTLALSTTLPHTRLLLWSTRWDETPVSRPAFFVCSIVSRNGKRWPEVDERLEGQLW